MTATVSPQTLYQGEKKVLEFTVMNLDVEPSVPLDLTSYTVRWAMSKVGNSGYSTTPSVKKDTAGLGGVVKTNPTAGICQVTLLRTDTATLSAGAYHQELEVVDALNEIAVVAVGDIEIAKNIDNAL